MNVFEGSDIETFADAGAMTDDFSYARGKAKKKRKKKKAKRKAKKAARKKKRKAKKAAKKANRKGKKKGGAEEAPAPEEQAAETPAAENPETAAPETPETETPEAEAPAEEEAPAEDETSDEGGEEEEAEEEENAEGSEKPATAAGSGGSSLASKAIQYKKPMINFVLPAIGFAAGAYVGHRVGSTESKTSVTHILVGGLIGAAVCSVPAIYVATKKDGTK